MAVVDITVIPVGTPSAGLSEFVAGCVKVLKEAKGVSYQLTPMSTIIEGELGLVLELVRKMHEQPFLNGAVRVVTTVRIDDRRDKKVTMSGKVAAVEARLYD